MTRLTPWSNVLRGVAYGDGWGHPNEFKSIEMLTEHNPQGPDLPEKLIITDDTQMTLYLASALSNNWDQDRQTVQAAILAAFEEYRTDPDNNRAPGVTVMSSLGAIARGKRWQDATSPTSDGSGTVMRTSPTAFLPADQWVGVTAFAAAVTHGSANGIAAAILNVALLRDILAGNAKAGQLLRRARGWCRMASVNGLLEVGDWLEGYSVPRGLGSGFSELERLIDQALEKLPTLAADPWALTSDPSLIFDPKRGGGWRAHECLVIALLSIDMLPNEPWEALRRSVTTDGDSDTIGAVTGALLGAGGAQWPAVFQRLEPRYRGWILEADHYEFADRPSWYKRLLGALKKAS